MKQRGSQFQIALLFCYCGSLPSQADVTHDTSRLPPVPVISEPLWVSPSERLPKQVVPMASNNNVGITLHDGQLYLAFRSSPTHFASERTVMHVIRSEDMGASWAYETTVSRGADLREPHLLSWNGKLVFYFFEGGTSAFSFQPKSMFRMERRGPADWTEPKTVGDAGEVPWEIKERDGKLYLTSVRRRQLHGRRRRSRSELVLEPDQRTRDEDLSGDADLPIREGRATNHLGRDSEPCERSIDRRNAIGEDDVRVFCNVCGLEDSFITGLYAAKRILG